MPWGPFGLALSRAWHDNLRILWKSWSRRYRDQALVGLFGILRSLARRAGLERTQWLAARLAPLVQAVLASSRRVSRVQLAHALPELSAAQRDVTVREMFKGMTCSVAEILVLEDLIHDIDRHVDAVGLEAMDEALAQGNGVIAITGHIGNWELLAAFFGAKGYPVSVIATPVKGEGLNATNVELRLLANVETIERDSGGSSRQILRTLKRGGILAILMDQNTRGQNVSVPFFARPVPTPVGPAALSLRTGAALVGVFIHRRSDGRHVVRVSRPDLPGRARAAEIGREAWVTEVTARLTALIEAEIREFPQDWVWWHERWST